MIGWRMGVFDTREIVVEGTIRTSNDELSSVLNDNFQGELLFAVTSKDIEDVVLREGAFPYIERVMVEKVLPDKIIVKVWERAPYVCLEALGTIDDSGEVILPGVCDETVPKLIFGAKEVDLEQVGAALRIKAALTQNSVPVAELTLLDHGDIVVTAGTTTRLQGWFSINGYHSITAQSALFVDIYTSSLNRDGRLVKIDVRFDKAYTERAK